MTTKNKIAVIISAICLIVSVSLIAIVTVWAATRQTVQATITVTYTSHDIFGSAQANWIVGGVSTPMTDGQGGNVLNFYSEDEQSTKVLKPELADDAYIELDDNNPYVVFEYIFTNKAEGRTYSATLTYDGADKNFNKFYLVSPTALSVAEYETKISDGTTFNNTLTCVVPAKQGDVDGTKYVYILIKVQDPNTGATFTGNFDWQLTSS